MRTPKITLSLLVLAFALLALSFSHTPNVIAQSATVAATEAPTALATAASDSNNSRLVYVDPTTGNTPQGAIIQTNVTFFDPVLKKAVESSGPTEKKSGSTVPLLMSDAILSPNGKLIAFTAVGSGGGRNLYAMAADGSNVRQLTDYTSQKAANKASISINEFAWSPDSTQLLYVYIEFIATPNRLQIPKSGLFLVNSDGSSKPQQIQIDAPAPFILGEYPAWSPDGKHILVVVDRNNDPTKFPQTGLVDVDLTSKRATPVLRDQIYFFPTWSPDSSHLIVEYADPQSKKNVVVITNPDGSNPRPLPVPDTVFAGPFAWSPDGTQIAFVVSDLGFKNGASTGFTGNHHIDVINADGSGLTTLVDLHVFKFGRVSRLSWGVIPPDVLAAIQPAPLGPTVTPSRTPIPSRTPRPTATPKS